MGTVAWGCRLCPAGTAPALGMGSTESTTPASSGAQMELEGAASEYQVLKNQEQVFVPRMD